MFGRIQIRDSIVLYQPWTLANEPIFQSKVNQQAYLRHKEEKNWDVAHIPVFFDLEF